MRACATIGLSLLLVVCSATVLRAQRDAPAKGQSKAAANDPAEAKKPTASVTKAGPKSKKTPPVVAQRELAKPAADVEFDDVALGEALDVLRGLCKANVFVDPAGLRAAGVAPDVPVTVAKDEKGTVKSVLSKVLAEAGKEDRKEELTFVTAGSVVVVSTAERAKKLVANLGKDVHRGLFDADLEALGTVFPEVKVEGVRLSDVLAFIGDISETPVEPNWEQLEVAGVERDEVVDLHLRDVTVAQALRLALESAGPTEPVAFVTIDGRTRVSKLEGLLDGLETQVEELDNVARAKASLKKKAK